MTHAPIVVIGGPTAVGKTGVAIAIARRIDGEIVSADSVQIYEGLDIGSAKPGLEERAGVAHHLIDIVPPTVRYSAARFVGDADAAISAIRGRNRLPIVVGGTGLYIRSLVHGLFEAPRDPEVRAKIEAEADRDGAAALHERLARVDAAAAERLHPNDRFRVARALEVFTVTGRPISALQEEHGLREQRYEALCLTLDAPRDVLVRRIGVRAEAMVDAGLVGEVEALLESGVPRDAAAFGALGYRHVIEMLDGLVPRVDLAQRIMVDTRRFARRQRTWFRGQWLSTWIETDGPGDAEAEVASRVEAALTRLERGGHDGFGAR